MKKPVVSTAWVERCWAKHEALPEEDFRLPVLSNTTICCTSLKSTNRMPTCLICLGCFKEERMHQSEEYEWDAHMLDLSWMFQRPKDAPV
jgi:hypothetical protein